MLIIGVQVKGLTLAVSVKEASGNVIIHVGVLNIVEACIHNLSAFKISVACAHG